jgi:conjugative transfer signal peptidase TraF
MTWALPLAVGVAAVIGTAAVGGVRWNGTPSMPRGLWLVRSLASQLHRGDIVAACAKPSDAVRTYVGKGECQDTGLEPLVKEVVAVDGDTVSVTEAGVVVNDALVPHSARLHVDGQGRSLDALFPIPAPSVVAPGFAWLVAPTDKSFDSRYLGAFPLTAIIGQMEPLLTE